MVLPVPDCFSFMLRLNSPDASRRNATRSRWLGSILACTLKTKPVTSLSPGSAARPTAAWARGLGAFVASEFNSSATPKFFSAEPK